MKPKNTFLQFAFVMAVLLLLSAVMTALAQETNAVPALPPLPTNLVDFWHLAIAGVTPFVVQLVKWVVPKIPTPLLPCATPVIGFALGMGLNYFAGQNFAWYDAAAAGLLGVGIREIVNQTVTKQISEPPQ